MVKRGYTMGKFSLVNFIKACAVFLITIQGLIEHFFQHRNRCRTALMVVVVVAEEEEVVVEVVDPRAKQTASQRQLRLRVKCKR